MVVRNVRGIGNRKPIPIYVWIPPKKGLNPKVEIIANDGTTYDITNRVLSKGSIKDGVTDLVGSFNLVIDNSDQEYTDKFTGGETLYYYSDYATTATTKRFRGELENISYKQNQIMISGRNPSFRLLEIPVTKSYTDTETSVIVKDLIDNYATEFTYVNVDVSTTNYTVNWYERPLWECLIELCNKSSFMIYADYDKDINYFKDGSRRNTTEAVVESMNILEIKDFAKDLSLIKNKIIVYGREDNGIPVIYTSEDTTSQTTYGVRKLVIKDESILTTTEAQQRADYELALRKDPSTNFGSISSLGLATIQPGDYVRATSPSNAIAPNYYKISSYEHTFNGEVTTLINTQKIKETIPSVLRDRISTEGKLSNTPNPNEMEFSYNIDLTSDSGTHSGTEITGGKLRATQAGGEWVSAELVLPSSATGVEARIEGKDLNGSKIFVSLNGKQTYTQIGGPGTQSLTAITGSTLAIKVYLASATAEVAALAILYNL